MPFKLKLKKSRQYNVSSKNLFVLSVELLDNTTVECTLSSQSLGQECLNNVCQRLGLQQPQYFGLKFLSKKGTFWWVDLQRPLKKQLDKYATENCSLSLGVMFFVSDVNILHDEVTRYHYFLQLKSDILEGKLHCTEEQTILFASYSLQAEFGDHDPERHTTEYLTNFGLLPKQMVQGKENQEAILERVILTHRSLQGMSQQLAEVYYIMEAQKLNGYGLECFAAKDNSGNSIIIGVSLMGIYIWYLNNLPFVYFRWNQIINLFHNKKCFIIEHRNNPKLLHNFMEDSHLAKYVWKTCIQQHCFYTKNEGIVKLPKSNQLHREYLNIWRQFLFHKSDNTSSSPSFDHQTEPKQPSVSNVSINSKPASTKQSEKGSKSMLHMQESQESLDGLGVYHADSGYSETLPATSSCSQIFEGNHSPEIPAMSNPSAQRNSITALNASSLHISSGSNSVSPSYSQLLPQSYNSQSNLSLLRRVSLSDASMHQQNHLNINETVSLLESKPICSVLPLYRQAPDYDTAIKLKYGMPNCGSANDMSASQSPPAHAITSGSQVDVSQVYSDTPTPAQSYNQYKNYTDLSHLDISELNRNKNMCDNNVLIRNQDHVSAPSLHLPLHTYSSPDLATQGTTCAERLLNAHMMYQFKPPPPYPYKQRSSSSTPDLTSSHQISQPCSSPDATPLKNLNTNIHLCDGMLGITNLTYRPPDASQCTPRKIVPEIYRSHSYEPTSVGCAKIVTSNAVPHQTIASSQKVGSQTSLPIHTYQNYNPTATITDSSVNHLSDPIHQVPAKQDNHFTINTLSSANTAAAVNLSRCDVASQRNSNVTQREDSHPMGPMLLAAMNGLCISRPDILISHVEEKRIPMDTRIQVLENRIAEGQVFLEFERIIKKKPNADFTTALLPENLSRNRFKDVFPYEENRVRLTPTNENTTGYINASHISLSLGSTLRFYIAAQGPLPNTLYSFWQMIWEHHVTVIVMLTEVQEQGRDKCFPYWPQEDGNKLQIGEFQIVRNFSMSSPTYVTCSLSLCHITSHQQRSVWHIQYTDWPDHSCPQDVQGFIAFMGEVDAVRRHALNNQETGMRSSPVVVHCSAGVGRSGAVILCDIMLYCLDHNQPIDIPKVLTHLRLQRMLTVQTLAQYNFVYNVLIQYLKNSRLI